MFDGRLAVYIFFVLSGDALSFSYFNGGGERSVVKLVLKRHSRLSIPIATICVSILLLANFGCVLNVKAAAIVHSEHWLGSFPAAPFTILRYFNYSMWRVYIDNIDSEKIDPFLWTMHFELAGSLFVFFLLLIRRHIAHFNVIVLVVSFLFLINKNLSAFGCFTFGVLFGEFRVRIGFLKKFSFSNVVWPAMLLCLAAIDGVTQWKGLLYDRKAFFAVPIVFAAYSCAPLCSFLNSRLSQILGVLSFPIYLVQYPVIISFTSWTILQASRTDFLTPSSAAELATLSVVVTLVSAAFFVPVEVFTKWVGEKTVQWLIKHTPTERAASDV